MWVKVYTSSFGSTFAFRVIQVRNIAVSHTFRIEKARQELGFSPKKFTLADSVDQYLRSRPGPPPPPASASSLRESRSSLFVLMMVAAMLLVGLVVLMLCPRWHQH